MAEDSVQELIKLYKQNGSSSYIGEPVTQLQHALQAAHLAEQEDYQNEVILGAFFHDIGHLIGERNGEEPMITNGTNLGIQDHAEIGKAYLESLGMKSDVSDLVGMHVQAKRYLVATDTLYYSILTEASRMTLEHQGGRMTDQEVKRFESLSLKDVILKMRTWDEKAKDPDMFLDGVSSAKALDRIEYRLKEYYKNLQSNKYYY